MEVPKQTTERISQTVDTLRATVRRVLGITATGIAAGMAIASAFEVVDLGSEDWDMNDPLASRDY